MRQDEFLYIIRHLQSHVEIAHMILGDFNIDFMKDECEFLRNCLANDYKMVNAGAPTHISGSLIDQVYVHALILNNYNIKVRKECVYFSDHDAIKLNITAVDQVR